MEAITSLRNSTYIKTTSLVLSIAVLFPILVHLIPSYQGIPIGAYLLPMFYIPFLALIWFKWKVALPAALFAPFLNFMLTGNPQWGFMGVLTFELLLFTGIAGLLLSAAFFRWVAAPLAYVGAKVISSFLLIFVPLVTAEPLTFFLNGVSNGVPGLFILLFINFLALKNIEMTR